MVRWFVMCSGPAGDANALCLPGDVIATPRFFLPVDRSRFRLLSEPGQGIVGTGHASPPVAGAPGLTGGIVSHIRPLERDRHFAWSLSRPSVSPGRRPLWLGTARISLRLLNPSRPRPDFREPTSAAARRNGKNGFHKDDVFFGRVNLPFFPLQRAPAARCRRWARARLSGCWLLP